MSSETYRASSFFSMGEISEVFSEDEDYMKSSVYELCASMMLSADGKDPDDQVMSYYNAVPKEDQEAARPYQSIYSVLRAIKTGKRLFLPGSTRIPDTTENFEAVLNFLTNLNTKVTPTEVQLTTGELKVVTRKWLAVGAVKPKQLHIEGSSWTLKHFTAFCRLWRRWDLGAGVLEQQAKEQAEVFAAFV